MGIERACNELTRTHEVDILCAYPIRGSDGKEDERLVECISALHSATYSRET